MIAIIDYGLSNLTCVISACHRLGHETEIVASGSRLALAEKIILPGVGAFGDAMANLRSRGLDEALHQAVFKEKRFFLGICLGAQLVCETSDEFGSHEGLGWVHAQVRSIDTGEKTLRVPHTGWDEIEVMRDCPLLTDISLDSLFYYTHSHAAYPDEETDLVARCTYGSSFAAIMNKSNIFTTQFHPEKSQRTGLTLLNNFLSLQ